MFALALAVILGVSGYGAYEHFSTQTWAERQEEVKASMKGDFIQAGAPEDQAEVVAACLAEKVTAAADEYECSAEGELLEAFKACAQGHQQEFGMLFLFGMQECVAKLGE